MNEPVGYKKMVPRIPSIAEGIRKMTTKIDINPYSQLQQQSYRNSDRTNSNTTYGLPPRQPESHPLNTSLEQHHIRDPHCMRQDQFRREFQHLKQANSRLHNEFDGLRRENQELQMRLDYLLKTQKQRSQAMVIIDPDYKKEIHKILQTFACDDQQLLRLAKVINMKQALRLMIDIFRKKADELKVFERENDEKYAKAKDKIRLLKEKVRSLTETQEHLKAHEKQSNSRLEQLKKEWLQTSEKLLRKELELEQKNVQIDMLKNKLKELVSHRKEQERVVRELTTTERQELKAAHVHNAELNSRLCQEHVKNQEMCKLLEEAKIELDQASRRERVLINENEIGLREITRWKERYEWLQSRKLSVQQGNLLDIKQFGENNNKVQIPQSPQFSDRSCHPPKSMPQKSYPSLSPNISKSHFMMNSRKSDPADEDIFLRHTEVLTNSNRNLIMEEYRGRDKFDELMTQLESKLWKIQGQ